MTKPAARYYDLLSANYDPVTSELGVWTTPEIMAQQIAPILKNGAKLLDIGIGTGQLIGFLRKIGQSIQVEGVEVSRKMSEICQLKYPDVKIHHGDILEIDFPDLGYFDMITICGALEFIPELNLLLQKCSRLLSESGYLVFTYEPVIIAHPIQNQEKSLTVPSSSDREQYVKDFFTYRYSPFQMYQELKLNGFDCQSDIEFVAYRKQEMDIIYHLIVAKKSKLKITNEEKIRENY